RTAPSCARSRRARRWSTRRAAACARVARPSRAPAISDPRHAVKTRLDSGDATVELPGMRLRQVVIAARDLEETVAHLTTVLDLEVAFRDPAVAEFGLVNAVMPVGDTFLEVVSPVASTAPARRFLDRHGDGGYMVILQSAALDEDRRRLAALGVRVVWQMDL